MKPALCGSSCDFGALLERDGHLSVAARCRGVYRRGDSVEIQSHHGPLLIAENDQRDLAPSEVLLISNVLVGGKKQVITGLLGLFNQGTVAQFMPTNLQRMG